MAALGAVDGLELRIEADFYSRAVFIYIFVFFSLLSLSVLGEHVR